MKKAVGLLLLLSGLLVQGQQTILRVVTTNFTPSPLTSRVDLYGVSFYYTATATADTNNVAYFSNLFSGVYQVILNRPLGALVCEFPVPNTNVVVDAWQACTNATGSSTSTNITLPPNMVVRTDGYGQLTVISNSVGLLTNSGAGVFGWVPFSALTNFGGTFTYSNAYFFQTNFVTTEFVTNMTVVSNAYFLSTNFFNTVTVTNGITNLSLTANTVLKADAQQAVTSIANGTGALTNNNAGLFGWYSYASLADVTNIVLNIVNTNSSPFTNNGSQIYALTSVPIYGNGLGLSNVNLAPSPLTNFWDTSTLFKSNTANASFQYLDANGNWYNTNTVGGHSLAWTNGQLFIDGVPLTNGIPSGVAAGTNIVVQTNGNLYTVSTTNVVTIAELNSASNSILSQFTNTINTTSNAILTQVTNDIATVSNNIIALVATNLPIYYTNLSTMAPDFDKPYAFIPTNASFAFLAPLNVDGKTKVQTCVVRVDNTSGSAIVATPPANVIVVSNSYMGVGANGTTWFTFTTYPPDRTNVYANAETH